MADFPQQHGVINFYKREGETPLQSLDRLRAEYPEYKDAVLSYAGRLDPLASGVLLVLAGDENKNREAHLSQSKEYEVEVLFGVSTDTYDALGLIVDIGKAGQFLQYEAGLEEAVKDSLKKILNGNQLPYPPFSSRPVNGRPLFQWAKEGRLDEISIPKQKGKIKEIELMEMTNIGIRAIEDRIYGSIDSVQGDFRQEEIMECWKRYFSALPADERKDGRGYFLVARLMVRSESGAYMRSLAHELGNSMGIPALSLSIVRTKVGSHKISDSLGFHKKKN